MPTPKRLPFRQRLLDYLLQVSLIIVGLVIATSVDRCNGARKDDRRLQAYYAAIIQDLEAERVSNVMNLADVNKDLADLEAAIRLFGLTDPDSLQSGLQRMNGVLNKGVFRTFSPTTFDVMVNTGDVNLVEDIELRALLASVFAFRNNVLRPDLQAYDRQVLATVESLSDRIDPACITTMRSAYTCIHDPKAIARSGVPELVVLATVARSRRFHLQVAQEEVLAAVERVGEAIAGG
ncbi:hypothetical protein [Lewinella sp. IMCC34191]|uniref:hypothetical protein n=1 Tax=Lewinella sp. IMCC34191 TaxID=2259172 RepID=UPI000E25DADB|nr:hypothetical protein [Lewinella sp. IMCC34191]